MVGGGGGGENKKKKKKKKKKIKTRNFKNYSIATKSFHCLFD
jgi:hypothetical protein